MSRRQTEFSGVGLYYLLVGLWCLLCWLARGVAWLFSLGMAHAGRAEEPSAPPLDIVPRSRGVPLFDDYDDSPDEVAEPSITSPELLGDADEIREYTTSRDPDGTIMLRVKEPSRYRRKLIPPGVFTHDD